MILATHGILANATLPSTLNTGLVAVYKAESNTTDSIGSYNGTAMGGLTYTTGKSGNAFDFNGTTSYVDMGDVMDSGTNSWTYSCWINTNNSTSGIIFSKAQAIYLSGRFAGFIGNNCVGLLFHIDNNVIVVETSNGSISTNTWYHIVFMVYRPGNLRIYINGSIQTLTTTSGSNVLAPYTNNLNTTNPFRIGAYTAADNVTPSTFFNGKIDEFSVWNRGLSDPELAELYNSGNGKFYPY